MGRILFQGAKVRKPLLAVSDVNDKGNVVIFDQEHPMIIPHAHPLLPELRAILKKIQGAIPLHREQGVFVMKTWRRKAPASDKKKKADNDMEVDSGFTRQGR